MNSVVIKRSAEQQKAEEERKIRVEAEMELLKRTQGETMARNMMSGKQDAEADKLDLATLLNVLDGVRETPGRIIVLSTNYPERLDEALLRPGRFDMMLEFEKHTPKVIRQHLEKHYDVTLTEEQWSRIDVKELYHKWTPAEVSQILFRRVADVNGAIDDLLKEDPKKLFKFSQLKQSESGSEASQLKDGGETSQLKDGESDNDAQSETSQESQDMPSLVSLSETTQEEQGTLLSTLQEQPVNAAGNASDSSSLAEKKKFR
jgi:hypothetical protein